jgi:hypothetical protein
LHVHARSSRSGCGGPRRGDLVVFRIDYRVFEFDKFVLALLNR